MIKGIGVDIISIKRIAGLDAQLKNKLANRILTPKEIACFEQLNSNKKIHYLAKRFAAKEAVSKALGTGIGEKVSFQNIDILAHISKQPYIELSGSALKLAQSLRITQWHISISDEEEYAIAYVIGE